MVVVVGGEGGFRVREGTEDGCMVSVSGVDGSGC